MTTEVNYEDTIKVNEFVDLSKNYSLSTGLLVLGEASTSNPNTSISHPAPVSLYPTPIPKKLFNSIYSIQPLLNELMDKVSLDPDFFLSILEPIAEVDNFIKNLLDIYKAIQPSSTRFGIFRSDYLLDFKGSQQNKQIDGGDVGAVSQFLNESLKDGTLSFKQVEMNTIASSFAALATKATDLHRYLLRRTQGYKGKFDIEDIDSKVPLNPALDNLVDGLAKAHSLGSKNATILFIVQDGEKNMLDQRHLEFELFNRHNVVVLRRTMHQLNNIQLNSENQLIIDGHLVSVVYFRAGYAPYDFVTEQDWHVRKVLEQSDSIKCPSIAYHLIGSKKVQQVLAQPNVLERFISNPQAVAQVRSLFTGLYPLDPSPEGASALDLALTQPYRYVLKPSREGGGNNHYDQDIPKLLNSLNRQQISQYILMDRIQPPTFQNNNLGLRKGEVSLKGDFVTEVGVYGVYLATGQGEHKKVLVNQAAGHLLRTKLKETDEGGVAVGHAVIDSPYLV